MVNYNMVLAADWYLGNLSPRCPKSTCLWLGLTCSARKHTSDQFQLILDGQLQRGTGLGPVPGEPEPEVPQDCLFMIGVETCCDLDIKVSKTNWSTIRLARLTAWTWLWMVNYNMVLAADWYLGNLSPRWPRIACLWLVLKHAVIENISVTNLHWLWMVKHKISLIVD